MQASDKYIEAPSLESLSIYLSLSLIQLNGI